MSDLKIKNMKHSLATLLILIAICSSCKKNDLPQTPVKYYTLSTDSLKILQTNIPDDVYNDLCFVTEKKGFAVSGNGNVVQTTDGGLGWTAVSSNPSVNLTRIQFVDALTGYATGGDGADGYLLKTTNGGASWQKLALHLPEPGWPSGMYFINAARGFITGKNYFRKTLDGGKTWTGVPGVTAESFNDVSFKSANNGFATAADGKYFTSTDGGSSWQTLKADSSQGLGKIFHSAAGSFSLTAIGLVDLSSGKLLPSAKIPAGAVRLLFLNDKNCIGIGQHYDTGFFPYGDIHLTNTAWSTSTTKTYRPFSEALDLRAMAKKSEGKVLIIGQAVMSTPVIELSY